MSDPVRHPVTDSQQGVTRAWVDALDLEPGDYATVHLGEWPEGITLRGPLVRQHDALVLGHLTVVRFDGEPCELLQRPGSTLTTAAEELRERLRADGRLWKQAYAEGEARGRSGVADHPEDLHGVMTPASLGVMTSTCRNCRRYVALVDTETPNLYRAMDLAADGYTPTESPHVCSESDRRP